MNLFLGALLLAQVTFSWEAPPPEENLTRIEILVSSTKGDYSNAQVINAGLPQVVNGRQTFNAMIDVGGGPKWAALRGVNSFGPSEPSGDIYLGKPRPLRGLTASPAGN